MTGKVDLIMVIEVKRVTIRNIDIIMMDYLSVKNINFCIERGSVNKRLIKLYLHHIAGSSMMRFMYTQ